MSEQSDQTQTQAANMVPVAALTAVQSELTSKDEQLAAQASEKAVLEAQVAAAQKALDDALALNAALKKAKEEAEVKAEAVAQGANFTRASSKRRWRIRIDEARDKSEVDPVFLSVNGRAYNIKRMRYVDVPEEVVSVLSDAVVGHAVAILDERTGIESGVEFRPGRRFPFENLGQSKDDNGDLMPGFEPLEK